MQEPGSALIAEIQREVRRQGPIPFAAFMQTALYHPRLGYYARPGFTTGAGGDYYTSPDLSDAFGRLIARQVIEIARLASDASEPFTLVEMGPGSGRMASDVAGALAEEAPELARRTTLVLVEISPSLRRAQQERLDAVRSAGVLAGVSWRSWGEILEGAGGAFRGCVVANEFLDALPVHVVEKREGVLREAHVECDGEDGLRETLLDLSTPRLARHIDALGIDWDEGHRGEIGLAALDWVASLGRLFGSQGAGGAILVDYGYPAVELYGPLRPRGTLMCYASHRASGDEQSPYQRVGMQDMTSHVDFTSVERTAREAGLDAAALTTQLRFLVSLGLARMMAALAAAPDATGADATRRRLAMHALMAPGGMGDIFKVLLLTRGIPAAWLTGARDPFRSGAVSEDAA